jgi:Zn-dependent M28 family amino/carboxypeptidase
MGPIVSLGFDPNAASGAPTGSGCDPAEWSGIEPGSIVLVQPAPCRRQQVVVNAQDAGALAIVTSYVDWERDHVLRPTLVDPAAITIPALGVTHDVGLALADAAAKGQTVHVAVDATVDTRSSPNVIAESPGGDPAHVVMLGGHLDSVMDGPGINDDGSGTMTVLEIARRLATLGSGPGVAGGSGWKVRVAFWSGEELGLFGSFAYTGGLGADAGAIEAYLNFDMLGSTNGVREVYSGELTQRAVEAKVITDLFGRAFDDAGLSWDTVVVGAASDHFPFEQVGVTTGGLFSGANERKTPDQAARFGGTADAFADPCYHLACDTVDNIDVDLLGQMAQAAGWVTGALASGEVSLD